jgi:uncharacterized membrane protein (DUF2068 family)
VLGDNYEPIPTRLDQWQQMQEKVRQVMQLERPQGRRDMTHPNGITVIAVYFLITGALSLLGAVIGLTFGVQHLGLLERTCSMVRLLSLPFALAALASSGLLYGIVALAVGWGLLRLHTWARWFAIVLAALTLLNFPIGTVIGALIICYLLQRRVAALFEQRET